MIVIVIIVIIVIMIVIVAIMVRFSRGYGSAIRLSDIPHPLHSIGQRPPTFARRFKPWWNWWHHIISNKCFIVCWMFLSLVLKQWTRSLSDAPMMRLSDIPHLLRSIGQRPANLLVDRVFREACVPGGLRVGRSDRGRQLWALQTSSLHPRPHWSQYVACSLTCGFPRWSGRLNIGALTRPRLRHPRRLGCSVYILNTYLTHIYIYIYIRLH